MRVVVSIGGSVLAPDLDADRVAAHADALVDLLAADHEVGVVTGGGTVAREYIDAARELGANEMELDHVGIAATRLNARLLIAALGQRAAPEPVETYEEGRNALRRGDLPVLGGVVAGQTTDAVSAAFAEYVDADLLVYATSVPGVFSADPDTDPDASKFTEIGVSDLVNVIAGIEMNAGSNAPVDLLAAKLIERSGIRAIVLDGSDPRRIVRAVENDDHDGTEIVPNES
ncbi:UMP kinase [Halorhabdus amylolytica]|uniref:UMP kinase n=1 Tax=Halorhabdus amylolytica TaxID=2559573 RepID=UPI0010AA1415|nr:UMP kinase [Halorhabdus amylolytica]